MEWTSRRSRSRIVQRFFAQPALFVQHRARAMDYDWKALTPHKPLDPGDAAYVTRASGGAQDIVDWVLAGGSTVLVGGPAGIGKSTELARAAGLLPNGRVSCFIPLDRIENMRRVTPDQLLSRIAYCLVYIAHDLKGLPVSESLRAAVGLNQSRPLITLQDLGAKSKPLSPPALLKQAISEVARLAQQRIAIIIDGLEKVPPGPQATELFDALRDLPEEVDLVVVIPWHAAFGASSDNSIVRAGEKLMAIRAIEVEGDAGEPGRVFLMNLLAKRLVRSVDDFDPAKRDLIAEAARWSGGIPRTFLQLMADAGTYARLRNESPWPEPEDMANAVADQQESFRRLLLPGDTKAIEAVRGTDGRELDVDRKVRLLAHGVLLERLRNRRPMLEIHPLAGAIINEGWM